MAEISGAVPAPDLDTVMRAALGAVFPEISEGQGPVALGIAVSGGGDSMALLHLARDCARGHGARLHAVTVDHGLRPAARAEAQMVAEVCKGLEMSHDILTWEGWDGSGNLQNQARRARYGLITGWARGRGISHVALGHTADDQAETFLMRLARGSGLDGLSAMVATRPSLGVTWLRPLLTVRREALRSYLRARHLGWVEDPSNTDPRFIRVQARQVLAELAPLGLDAEVIRETTARLAKARAALEAVTADAARRLARVEAGDVVIDSAGLADLPAEIRRRLIAHSLNWVASAEYRPRAEALAETLAAIGQGRAATLHGCRIIARAGALRISRELQAVKGRACAPDQVWDGRWRLLRADGATEILPGEKTDLRIDALGVAGLAACPDWRATGLPRVTLEASPALWSGTDLQAAPLAGWANGWRAELLFGDDAYNSSILYPELLRN